VSKPLLSVMYGQCDVRPIRLPSQPKLVLIAPIHGEMARLSWPGWLVIYRDSLPARRR